MPLLTGLYSLTPELSCALSDGVPVSHAEAFRLVINLGPHWPQLYHNLWLHPIRRSMCKQAKIQQYYYIYSIGDGGGGGLLCYDES